MEANRMTALSIALLLSIQLFSITPISAAEAKKAPVMTKKEILARIKTLKEEIIPQDEKNSFWISEKVHDDLFRIDFDKQKNDEKALKADQQILASDEVDLMAVQRTQMQHEAELDKLKKVLNAMTEKKSSKKQ